MRSIENMPGIVVGRHGIKNLHYVDDTGLIETGQKDLQKIVDTVVIKIEKMGFSLKDISNGNIKETNYA